jgi:hypothetical protein
VQWPENTSVCRSGVRWGLRPARVGREVRSRKLFDANSRRRVGPQQVAQIDLGPSVERTDARNTSPEAASASRTRSDKASLHVGGRSVETNCDPADCAKFWTTSWGRTLRCGTHRPCITARITLNSGISPGPSRMSAHPVKPCMDGEAISGAGIISPSLFTSLVLDPYVASDSPGRREPR